jgi:hypothetical protein
MDLSQPAVEVPGGGRPSVPDQASGKRPGPNLVRCEVAPYLGHLIPEHFFYWLMNDPISISCWWIFIFFLCFVIVRDLLYLLLVDFQFFF